MKAKQNGCVSNIIRVILNNIKLLLTLQLERVPADKGSPDKVSYRFSWLNLIKNRPSPEAEESVIDIVLAEYLWTFGHFWTYLWTKFLPRYAIPKLRPDKSRKGKNSST